MLGLAVVFFFLAIASAAFGFGGIATTAIESAKILFVIFVALFVVALVAGLLRNRHGPDGISPQRHRRSG